jgi:hypothetical protein
MIGCLSLGTTVLQPMPCEHPFITTSRDVLLFTRSDEATIALHPAIDPAAPPQAMVARNPLTFRHAKLHMRANTLV